MTPQRSFEVCVGGQRLPKALDESRPHFWIFYFSMAVEQRGGALNASHHQRAQFTSALIDAQRRTITSFARRQH
jgi:hypothetical protein